MIDIGAGFNPGRALKPFEKVVLNGVEYVFNADMTKDGLVPCSVAVFKPAEGDFITILNKPLYGLQFSADIDRDIYWSTVTGWMIR
ncbi:hypothetical protein NCTGTJJY_CDS0091 [Serratia phage 92A1]|nr:hypothetical protein NCTGTJJY_CDS0091 [Serratia phage 92A1]